MKTIILILALSSVCLAESIVSPVKGRVSSGYGLRLHPLRKQRHLHEGIDLAAPKHTPIRALGAGRVIFAGSHGGYGKLIAISHTRELVTLYGHCEELRGVSKNIGAERLYLCVQHVACRLVRVQP
jgi:murein DD-endopeptidase MepM/ murein hydrolase activator NlpD